MQFSTILKKVGINPCVRVPARISNVLQSRGYIPVYVYLDRGMVPSTLVPVGGGVHRLYINAAMLELTDARVGERISLRLKVDRGDRTLRTPADLLAVLQGSKIAEIRWGELRPSKRKEIIRYISFAKTAETRRRNISKLADILESDSGYGVLAGIEIETR